MRSGRCGGEGADERQHLPLRSLRQHCCGNPRSSQARSQEHLTSRGVISMRTFDFHRPENAASAIAAGARAKTAQQGADVRFLAGGTTLIDLMKLEVETPGRLL